MFWISSSVQTIVFLILSPTAPPPKHVFSALLFVMASMIITYQGSAHCDEILATHPTHFCLPPAEADELTACAFVYLAVWQELFEHYKNEPQPLFGLTGKAHIMLHACLLSRSGDCKNRQGPHLKT